MKSSLPSSIGFVQSLSLPGRLSRGRCRALARHFGLRCAAGLARPRREDDARDDRLGDADVVIQPVLQRRTDDAIHDRQQLGIVQPILGLSLELGFLHERTEHAGQPLANVLGGERHALRRQAVRFDEVADRLADAGAQAVLVRAARTGRDAVDVRPDVLVGRFGPLEHEVEPDAFVPAQHERRFVYRLAPLASRWSADNR